MCLTRHEKTRLSIQNLDTYLNNFGPRFRRLVESRGTIETAYKELGVSRATLFNWFARDTLPPGLPMQEKIRRYLGEDAAFILDQGPKRHRAGEDDALAEEQAPYGAALARQITRQSIETWVTDYLDLAETVPGGLGFAWGQLRLNLRREDLVAMRHAAPMESTDDKLRRLKRQAGEIRGGESAAIQKKTA